MKTRIVRYTLVGILTTALAISSVASAGDAGKGCSFPGTWFGVVGPEDFTLTGWMVTVAGKSSDHGTNILEYPTFNPNLFGLFDDARHISTLRGTWERTGGNTFAYTMAGIAVAADGLTPVWIAKVSGNTTLSPDCSVEHITATIEAFIPSESPFDGDPLYVIPLPDHYGYRAGVELP